MKKLTKHFSYDEMTRTDTGISNIPSADAIHYLYDTCRILEIIRDEVGFPLPVNSGYRSLEVHHELKKRGYSVAENSLHLFGRAVDIRISHLTDIEKEKLFNALERQLPTEYIIHDTYVHVAF